MFFFLSAAVTESCSVPCDYSVTPGGGGGMCVLLRDKGPSMEQSGPNRGAFLPLRPRRRILQSRRNHMRNSGKAHVIESLPSPNAHIFPLAPARPPSLSLTRPLLPFPTWLFDVGFFFIPQQHIQLCEGAGAGKKESGAVDAGKPMKNEGGVQGRASTLRDSRAATSETLNAGQSRPSPC